MKKSVARRIRVTKTGKFLRRPMGVNHFKAKKSGKQNRMKRRMLELGLADRKTLKAYF